MSLHMLVFSAFQEKKMLERRAAELEEELKVRACDHGRLVLIGSLTQFWMLIGWDATEAFLSTEMLWMHMLILYPWEQFTQHE